MHFELLDFTCELSKAYNTTPFEIFKQDTSEVITILNYYIEKGETQPTAKRTPQTVTRNAETRIRVNDKTATGGWF